MSPEANRSGDHGRPTTASRSPDRPHPDRRDGLAASRRFYEAVLEVVGVAIDFDAPGFFSADELVVSSRDSEAAQGRLTGPVHLAFQASDRGMVDAFHAAALRAGGTDNGGPGVRAYHPGYYAAFVLDPDGNNIEVVHHGPAERSAASILIRFGDD